MAPYLVAILHLDYWIKTGFIAFYSYDSSANETEHWRVLHYKV